MTVATDVREHRSNDAHRRRRVPAIALAPGVEAFLLGLLVALTALVNLISAFTPNLHDRMQFLHDGLTPGVSGLAHGATAILGIGLLLVGRGLARRRRLAYLAALVLLGVSALAHILKGLDVEEATVVLVVAGLLWRARGGFLAPGPHAPRRPPGPGTPPL